MSRDDSAPGLLQTEAGQALPAGSRVAEFEIRSVLGSGGFGIVYLAWDDALHREVALKEYMPGALAGRAGDMSVSVRSSSMAETFSLGLRSFVNEARMLARFDHPALVKVYRFWEDNGTAYMVMPFYKGRTLRRVRAGMALPPTEGACRKVLDALLSALDVLHKEGVYHRDIAPDNILIGEDDGAPVLLDFGAARRVIEGEGGQKALTSIMKPNFAPLEQYADQSAMRQGPWTDLYALGGTVYFLLTGAEPVPAASRALHDDLPRLGTLGLENCSPAFLDTVDWMLAIRPADRPQSVHMLRDVLEGRMALPARAHRPDFQRTVPGVASREVDILTSPGDLSPVAGAAPADHAHSPTVLMPPPPAAPAPLPLPEAALAAPQPAARRALLPQRSSLFVLCGLVALNILAWWWFTRESAPPRATPEPAAARAAAVPAPKTAAATPPTAPTAAPAAPAEASETILSVLPARAVRPSGAASAAALPGSRNATADNPGAAAAAPPAGREGAATTTAPAAGVATPSRDATADAARAAKAATAGEPIDPRTRCGQRNFLSALVCLKRECSDPALSAHAECVKLREQEAAFPRPER